MPKIFELTNTIHMKPGLNWCRRRAAKTGVRSPLSASTATLGARGNYVLFRAKNTPNNFTGGFKAPNVFTLKLF